MKTIFTLNGVVIGIGHTNVLSESVILTSGISSTDYRVPDTSQVDVGWAVEVVNGEPVFSAPAAQLPILTAVQLYYAFTTAERIAIKASTDPIVKEFWSGFELVASQPGETIDPNLVSFQEALAYLAAPVSPGPGAGILASAGRIGQISAGIAQ